MKELSGSYSLTYKSHVLCLQFVGYLGACLLLPGERMNRKQSYNSIDDRDDAIITANEHTLDSYPMHNEHVCLLYEGESPCAPDLVPNVLQSLIARTKKSRTQLKNTTSLIQHNLLTFKRIED